jgi:Spy/CpxP family protein refolding chaperone
MLRKIKFLGLILASTFALTTPMMVYADDSDGNKDNTHQAEGWHHGGHDKMMAKILNLTDDQQKQLKENWKKQKEAMKGVFGQMKTAKEAFDAEIVKASPDMSKISTIQNQIKTLQSQMLDNRLNGILEVKKILTPEQFAGYMALKKERMLKKHMMGHGWFGHKDSFGKGFDGHKPWGDKEDGDHDAESQD